jgi:hypothetical protein
MSENPDGWVAHAALFATWAMIRRSHHTLKSQISNRKSPFYVLCVSAVNPLAGLPVPLEFALRYSQFDIQSQAPRMLSLRDAQNSDTSCEKQNRDRQGAVSKVAYFVNRSASAPRCEKNNAHNGARAKTDHNTNQPPRHPPRGQPPAGRTKTRGVLRTPFPRRQPGWEPASRRNKK